MSITSVLFKVTGTGEFPVDMLRHDKCWPADSISARAIVQRDRVGGVATRKVRIPASESARTVYLRIESGWGHFGGPSVARWKRFGWEVEIVEARCDGEDITAAVTIAANAA